MKRYNLSFLVVVFFLKVGYSLSQTTPTILIAYYSQSGNTKAMGEAVEKGALTVDGIQVRLKCIQEVTEEHLLLADAIILGSPVYNGNMSPKMMEFVNSWPFEGRPLKDKIGAVFVTGGGFSIGEEAVMFSLIRSMLIHGMVIVGGYDLEAAFGASAITGEGDFAGKSVDPLFLQKAEGLGRRVAELMLR
nr:flavodoxin family protein [Cytophagales bacterium]